MGDRLTDKLSIEQIERADWTVFTRLEKVMIAGELYGRAPVADPFVKRQWVADRLGLPLREVNRILWSTHGIRWSKIAAREPRKRRRKPPAACSEQSAEKLRQLCEELHVDITDIL